MKPFIILLISLSCFAVEEKLSPARELKASIDASQVKLDADNAKKIKAFLDAQKEEPIPREEVDSISNKNIRQYAMDLNSTLACLKAGTFQPRIDYCLNIENYRRLIKEEKAKK